MKRINEVPFISIIVDSTPDVSHQEMSSIIVSYCLNFHVEERLFAFEELISKAGEKIVGLIISCFKKYGVSTAKIVAQSYDGAPNMSGKSLGVQALLNEALNTNVHVELIDQILVCEIYKNIIRLSLQSNFSCSSCETFE